MSAAQDEGAVLARLLADTGPSGVLERYGDDPDQVYEVYGPERGPLLVVVHGGYFRPSIDRAHARPQARALADAGYRVVLAEYRRVPGDPVVSVTDLEALEDHLGELGTWVGHSAGGTLVLLRGATPDRPRVPVLALAPVADLVAAAREELGDGAVVDWVGGTPEQQVQAYATVDPRQRWSAPFADAPDAPRVLLAHGDADATVPLHLSTDFPAESVTLAGAHHFDVVDPQSPHWPRVLELVREVSG